MAEWEILVIDEEAAQHVNNYYKLIWQPGFGVSDTDGLDAGYHASVFFSERTDWDAGLCLERGLDIAFEVLDQIRSQHG